MFWDDDEVVLIIDEDDDFFASEMGLGIEISLADDWADPLPDPIECETTVAEDKLATDIDGVDADEIMLLCDIRIVLAVEACWCW